MKKALLLAGVCSLAFLSPNLYADYQNNFNNVIKNPKIDAQQLKKVKKPKLQNINRYINLSNAVITTRNCVDREFFVRSNSGRMYRVYFVGMNGERARGSRDQLSMCNRHRQGFEAGDRVNVRGTYALRNNQHVIYNAVISSR